MNYDKNKLKNAVIVAVFAAIAGYAFFVLSPDFPVRGDTLSQYHPIAKNLAEGKGFWNNNGPTARVAPAYPFLLSLIYRAGGEINDVYAVQIILLAGIGIISYLIAKIFIPYPLSLLASLNIVLWPYLLLYTKLALTEITFILLLTLAVYFLVMFAERQTVKLAALSGAFMGLAALVRPVILLLPLWFVGAAYIYIFILNKKQILNLSKKLAVFLAAFAVVLTPWTIRNAIQLDAFIPIASGLSDSIHRGYDSLDYTLGSEPLKEGEATISDNIIARFRNIYLFWNPGAGGDNAALLIQESPLFNTAFWAYRVIFLLTAFLALFAFALKKTKGVAVLIIVILYFWSLHSILYPYPRYTLPIIPLVIILAWITTSRLWTNAYSKYKQYRK